MAEPTLLELISGGKVRHGGTGKYKEEEGAIVPLTESKLVTDFVLPMVTGATAATEDYEPGALDVAFAIPVVGKAGRVGVNIGKKWAKDLFSKKTLGRLDVPIQKPNVFPIIGDWKGRGKIKALYAKFKDKNFFQGNAMLPETSLTQSQRALVKETRDFTKESLTNEEGYKRFIKTFFVDSFIEPDEMELLQDYLMNSSRGKEFWKSFKTMVEYNIDSMDYRKMVKTNPANTAWGVHRGRHRQVGVRQFTDPLKTGPTNVHEFTHAGQLQEIRYSGGSWSESSYAQFQKKTVNLLNDIFDFEKNPDILSANTKLQTAMAKAKGLSRTISDVVDQRGTKEIFHLFQGKLTRSLRPEAKEIMKKQFDDSVKKGGLLNYLRKKGKYSREVGGVGHQNYIKYLNDWWETTARLNEMRYIEHLGLDAKKSKAYRQLQDIYDNDFIKDIYKYSWAGIPVSNAEFFGEPDEHLNRLEKIE